MRVNDGLLAAGALTVVVAAILSHGQAVSQSDSEPIPSDLLVPIVKSRNRAVQQEPRPRRRRNRRGDCGQRVMQFPASANDSDDANDEHDFHRRKRRDRPAIASVD
jgi:hypothetical protein